MGAERKHSHMSLDLGGLRLGPVHPAAAHVKLHNGTLDLSGPNCQLRIACRSCVLEQVQVVMEPSAQQQSLSPFQQVERTWHTCGRSPGGAFYMVTVDASLQLIDCTFGARERDSSMCPPQPQTQSQQQQREFQQQQHVPSLLLSVGTDPEDNKLASLAQLTL